MNISLPPQLESFVRTKVDSGTYTSASEVIREALRVFQLYENFEQKRFLQQAIEEQDLPQKSDLNIKISEIYPRVEAF